MKLTTLLKKHFDIKEITDVDSTVNREVYTIWVYEKGEDCEPLLILKDAQDFMGVDGWLVGNIYSTLQHGLLLQHEELKTMIRNGEIKSR
ncbi:cobalamin biosynthesis protein CbiX [Salmonella enterica subsp. enterica serovar Typhimurium]|nr:cobalamin biosynthesis protein CbiX [Salmonella enterica subsp. enterica serovar Typhimurium]